VTAYYSVFHKTHITTLPNSCAVCCVPRL